MVMSEHLPADQGVDNTYESEAKESERDRFSPSRPFAGDQDGGGRHSCSADCKQCVRLARSGDPLRKQPRKVIAESCPGPEWRKLDVTCLDRIECNYQPNGWPEWTHCCRRRGAARVWRVRCHKMLFVE